MSRAVDINGIKIGGGSFAVIAGPCCVESESQILQIAQSVKQSGAQILRGGAFKPRTSPYDFQGLHADGIRHLLNAKKSIGLPVVSEITNINDIPLFCDVDMIQIGARNMQNYDLITAVGKLNKPVLLKRGLANTLEELLLSAEYITCQGNKNVVLCERGIRTFADHTRYTLDLSVVCALHEMTDLPVVVDPSHSTGNTNYVESMALAAAAAGADGIMVEVHNNPKTALCDGAQAITPQQFNTLTEKIKAVRAALKF